MTDTDESEHSTPSRLARALFANGLAILTTCNLTDLDGRIAYAEAKGVPEAGRFVPATTDLLPGGSSGIEFWKLPRLTSASITASLTGVTPTMRDFWAVDDDARDERLTSFPQSLTLFGVVLAFFKCASDKQQPKRSRSVFLLRIHDIFADAVWSEPERVQIPQPNDGLAGHDERRVVEPPVHREAERGEGEDLIESNVSQHGHG